MAKSFINFKEEVDKASKREEGSSSLVKKYKKDTPGESVDELNKSTMARYTRAAARDINHQGIKGNLNKIKKRVYGIDKATYKLAMKKEEVGLKTNEENKMKSFFNVRENTKLEEKNLAGFIANFKGKKLEIKKNEVSSLYGAKQLAIQKLKIPKSQQGLLSVNPAYESVEVKNDKNINEAISPSKILSVAKAISNKVKGTVGQSDKGRYIVKANGKRVSVGPSQSGEKISVASTAFDQREAGDAVAFGVRKIQEEADFKQYRTETLDEARFTDKQIKMAYGIINDPRWKGGNMTSIVRRIEGIAKGLSNHPGVKTAIKSTNEEFEALVNSYMAEANDDDQESSMAVKQLEFIEYAAEEINDWIDDNNMPEWFQNKLTQAFTLMQGLHSYAEGESGDENGDDDKEKKNPVQESKLNEASTVEIEKALKAELKGRKDKVLTAKQWSQILFSTHRELGLIHATKLEPILKKLKFKLK